MSESFGKGRFDRSVDLFARYPALGVPLAFAGLLLGGLSLAPTLKWGEWPFAVVVLYALLLMVVLHLYFSAVLNLALIWQLFLMKDIDADKSPRVGSALRAMTRFDAISWIELVVRTVPQVYEHLRADPAAFLREARLHLARIAWVWEDGAFQRANGEGARLVKLHARELAGFRGRLPMISRGALLVAAAVLVIFQILPESFMTMSLRWISYPMAGAVLCSLYCAQMEWVAVYVRHQSWERDQIATPKDQSMGLPPAGARGALPGRADRTPKTRRSR